MYLRSLTLENFKACKELTIELDRHLTILAGENNSGKSTVLDALRLLTLPLDDHRDFYPKPDHVTDDSAEVYFCASAEFAELTDGQLGLHISALGSHEEAFVRYGLRYTPPPPGSRRGNTVFWAGNPGAGDPEPEARRLIRHVYLPALRDAQRVLASGSADRIALLVRHLAGPNEVASLEGAARDALGKLSKHQAVETTTTVVQSGLSRLTEGVSPQQTNLGFAESKLIQLARDLRFQLADQGITPTDLERSGLGYANLLYMATILAELDSARDTDLTLLLVEEPEAHLHPQLQSAVVRYLEEQAVQSQQVQRPTGEPAGHIQVILTTHSPNVTAAASISHAVILTSQATVGTEPLQEGSGALPSTQQTKRRFSAALPIKRLGLDPKVVKKLDRYLDVTRSALLFSRRALLIEGVSEGILLRSLALRVVLREPPMTPASHSESRERSPSENDPDQEIRMRRSRFNATCLIPIDGVDFDPYLNLLLSQYQSRRLADRVVVITDEDPTTPGDRKSRIEGLAATLGARDIVSVFLGPSTLEAAIFPRNAGVLEKAFRELHPQTDRWIEIMAKSEGDQPQAFVDLLKATKTRKGEFAQAVAALVDAGSPFSVPKYLEDAIKRISESDEHNPIVA